METIKIELPDHMDIKRGGEVVRIAFGNMNASIIAQLVMHGATQKVGDAAAGKSGDEARSAMEAVMTALANGEWGRQRAANGATEFDRVARSVTKARLKAKLSAEDFKRGVGDLDAAEQAEMLDKVFAKNEAALRPIVEAEVARRAEERKRKAELDKKVNVDLDGIDL